MKASELMSTSIGCCEPQNSIREAAVQMRACDCGAIPVVDSNAKRTLIGLITDRDITIRAVAEGRDPDMTSVDDIMTRDIVTASEDADVEQVERIMESHQVRRVPIIDGQGCVCGMISQADIALSRPATETAEVVQSVSKAYAG